MNDVHISPGLQRLAVLAVLVALAAAVAAQLPELQRYIKIRQM